MATSSSRGRVRSDAMSIRTISATARLTSADPPRGRVVVERLLARWIDVHFLPVAVSGLWGDRTLPLEPPFSGETWNGRPLWSGERDTDGPLTRVAAADLAIRDRL